MAKHYGEKEKECSRLKDEIDSRRALLVTCDEYWNLKPDSEPKYPLAAVVSLHAILWTKFNERGLWMMEHCSQ